MKTNARTAVLRETEEPTPDIAKLARLIAAYAPHDGSFELKVPGLLVSRISRVNKECVHALRISSLCIVAQGAKTVIVGDEVYEYDASQMIVFSVALPVAAQVTQATPAQPYLSLRLELDPRKIAELVLKVYPHGLPPVQERKAVYLIPADESIVNAATRLLECLAHPGDTELVAPLVVEETLIRLLRSPIGIRVAQMGFAESSVHRVAKAISWLRENFPQPMRVEELAELVHMSVSSFHEHFKSVTSMSPLHYQKVLRLQEARRLMLSATMDAGAASQQGVSERLSVQQGIQPVLRQCADEGHRQAATRYSSVGVKQSRSHHERICGLAELLCDRRVVGRRTDRIAVCGRDADCQHPAYPDAGTGWERVRDAEHRAFWKRAVTLCRSERSLARRQRSCHSLRSTGSGGSWIFGDRDSTYAITNHLPSHF